MLPSPFYIRLLIYYNYEHEEMIERRSAISRLGLTEKFNLYRTNVIQYFSPVHGIFLATYCLYFVVGVFVGFATYK